jgi:hypothetical protein
MEKIMKKKNRKSREREREYMKKHERREGKNHKE